MMLTTNPFAALNDYVSPLVLQAYLVLMALGVAAGTLFDVYHKGSAKFFVQRKEKSRAAATRQISGAETFALAIETIAEAAVSGEFCKWPRRTSHLLMMYGFFFYAITSAAMVFYCPGAAQTPAILPALWTIGASMILIGGLWFFFFLRVNVAFDGDSPFHLGRADLFVGSLIASACFALIWDFLEKSYANQAAAWTAFGLYILFTTLLFLSVPWSKFAHMFFKPAVAFERRVEEANGSSDLPSPTDQNFIVRS
ncbi:MAG: hypothetical protein WAM63_15370 [Rhodomicrobium sp.]